MPHRSLADFLEQLALDGQLARIGAEVDPELEIAEITRRVAEQDGPALLFEKVRGQSLAVVTNLLGTKQRASRALGLDSLDDLVDRLQSLVERSTPQNWFDRLRMTGEETGLQKYCPKVAKAGSCQQVVRLGRDIDLAALPLVKAWPGESAGAITSGLIVTQGRAAEGASLTWCPLVAIDAQRLAVVDDGCGALAQHQSEFRAAGEKMPLAIVLGGDPAMLLASQLELPREADAFQTVGLSRGAPLEIVKCRTHDLMVPADADLVLEGFWDPQSEPVELPVAAPAGQHYRANGPLAAISLAAITQRAHPIWPALIEGTAGERAVLTHVRERMLLSGVQALAPDVVDLHLPLLGGADRFAVASLTKRRPFHARQVAAALWSQAAVGRAKFLILVDADVDVHDLRQVWSAVGAHVAPERDLFSHDGPASASDHANTLGLLGRHVALDATAKISGECPTPHPDRLVADPQTRDRVTARWAEFKLALGGVSH